MATPKAENDSGPLTRATVAPRRTITTPDKSYGPGSIVQLPRSEVGRLRAAGFLIGEDASDAVEVQVAGGVVTEVKDDGRPSVTRSGPL